MEHDTFTAQYIKTALWVETDDCGEALGDSICHSGLAPEAEQRMAEDCAKFQKENAKYFGDRESDAGHDFWLTRNGHGAGFWEDDDWPIYGAQLDNAAKDFGECSLYVGDDGFIYCG